MTGGRWLTAGALAVLVGGAVFGAVRPVTRATPWTTPADVPAAKAVDRWFEARWVEQGLRPAAQAEDLAVLRRLTLALTGTVPSLEEIRRFEADAAPGRLDRWAGAL